SRDEPSTNLIRRPTISPSGCAAGWEAGGVIFFDLTRTGLWFSRDWAEAGFVQAQAKAKPLSSRHNIERAGTEVTINSRLRLKPAPAQRPVGLRPGPCSCRSRAQYQSSCPTPYQAAPA